MTESGLASDDDVTGPLTNEVSSLRVTCDDVDAHVEMFPAGSGVDSDEENKSENDKSPQELS